MTARYPSKGHCKCEFTNANKAYDIQSCADIYSLLTAELIEGNEILDNTQHEMREKFQRANTEPVLCK